MTKASAYTIEEIVEVLEDAHSDLLDHLQLKNPERRTRKLEDYESGVKKAYDMVVKTVGKYPEDEEFKEYFDKFNKFIAKKEEGIPIEKEKKWLEDFLSDIRRFIHWRKLEISSGKELPFRDYRSLRGERGRRGI
jgi:oligoribonuclease (3'-5' exoribonuclease)